jgi:Bor protein
MHRSPRTLLVVACVLSLGCYHATVETGATPSPEVIDKSFASGWIYGLVPPSTLSTAAKCPNGPAKVETKLSFVNQLVSFLTLGIYTPMQITVTCAASGAGVTGAGASQ